MAAKPALRLLTASETEVPPALTRTALPFVERVPAGKLIELSGTGAAARTTTAVAVLRAIQREGDTAVWVQPRPGWLYPPDLHESGIDLDALTIVQIPLAPPPAPHAPLLKASEMLLQSGGFGLLVLDLCAGHASYSRLLSSGWAGRLLALSRQHEARVLLLTEKPANAASLGPLIGLRVAASRKRVANNTFAVSLDVLKNKSGNPHILEDEPLARYRGPWGLR